MSVSINANEWSMESELNSQESTNRSIRGLLSPFYWETDDHTKEFTIGKNSIYWIDETNNLQDKPDQFFAYILGKNDNTSALVRANTIKDENGVITSFTFDVIKGLIDKEDIIDRSIDKIADYISNLIKNDSDPYEEESKIDYMTELSHPDQWGNGFAFKTNMETFSGTENSENFDNIKYESYQDEFLLQEANNKKLAEVLPSHLLYSPEDYIWDSMKFKLVATESVDENLTFEVDGKTISYPYIDQDLNEEGTIGKIFKDTQQADRTPILFIHGWQGGDNNAFDILHEYDWASYSIKDSPTSADSYWRNMLTYMYRDHYDDFKQFKPYVYHYPSYKHAKFNARMLKDLLDEIDDEVIRKGIENNQLIIIGHSMGTIVSRSLMEEFGYLPHVKQFISLAGVHHGSPGAIASLIESSALIGKDLYTPGACDLIVDNYDGFINQAIIDDIHRNSTAKELLKQREACGSVVISDRQYNTEEDSFDLYYLNELGVKEYYVEKAKTSILDGIPILGDLAESISLTNSAVPYHSNPWLLHLNKKHQELYQDITNDKYIFYAGYTIATIINNAEELYKYLPDPDVEWKNWLSDDFAMDSIASFAVAGQSYYNFLDSVVLLPHAIFDTSRGRLLKDGDLTTTYGDGYDKNISMDSNLQASISTAELQDKSIFIGNNSWGANFRLFADYHHDRMLNGGYTKPNIYRLADNENRGSGHKDFDNYGEPGLIHFKSDPLFEQVKQDILSLSLTNGTVEPIEENDSGSFDAGIKQCQQDPASCEIISNCLKVETHALFSDGVLTIPAVDIPDGSGSFVVYSGLMAIVPGEELLFSVTSAEPIQLPANETLESIEEDSATDFNAGIKQCKQNPASCGIQSHCPKVETHALFSANDGIITIPAVDIPDSSGNFVVYSGAMAIISGEELLFSVTNAEPVQ